MSEHYPNAALRHLTDSQLLLKESHWHGSAYLAGYVIECSLKACITHPELPEDVDVRDIGHNLPKLTSVLDGMAASRRPGRKRNIPAGLLATLASRLTAQDPVWEPAMRYRTTDLRWEQTAKSWWELANRCFSGIAKGLVAEGA